MRPRLQINERDRKLFLTLHSYGLLTTRQVQLKVFSGIRTTTMLRRLRRLEKCGYVSRIPGLEGGGHAWRVTDKGALVVTQTPSKRYFPRNQLEHDLVLSTTRLALEGCGIARSWIPEHEIRPKVARKYGLRQISERTIPDGIMGVIHQGLKESVAIELELNWKNERRYRRTFLTYVNKASIHAVWYLVSSVSLGKNIERVWKKSVGQTQRPWLLWSIASEVIADPLTAIVHSYGNTVTVEKAWNRNIDNSPAHSPAHAVSTLEAGNKANSNQLSTENESEELAPTEF